MTFLPGTPIVKKLGDITCQFGEGCQFIDDSIVDGDSIDYRIVGEYADNDVACYIVEVLVNGIVYKTQKESKTLLHITTRCEGVSPVQSGLRATAFGFTPIVDSNIYKTVAKTVLAD